MRANRYLLFGAFGILLASCLLVNFLGSDFVASVIPGWHTTILPVHSLLFTVTPMVLAYCAAAAYMILPKLRIAIPNWLPSVHLVFSLPYLIGVFWPMVGAYYIVALGLFFIAQMMFFVTILLCAFSWGIKKIKIF